MPTSSTIPFNKNINEWVLADHAFCFFHFLESNDSGLQNGSRKLLKAVQGRYQSIFLVIHRHFVNIKEMLILINSAITK